MKKTIITLLFALVTMAGQAQEQQTIEGRFKMNEESYNDYIPLLKAKGYEAFSFDLSAIKGKYVTIHFREYVDGKEVEDSPKLLMPYTFETRGDKLIIGTLPSENDSIAQLCFNLENTLSFGFTLKRNPLYWESENRYVYSYRAIPFELTMPLDKETFIPLVLYCSFWYDEKDKVTRCCGETHIAPDLSSDIPKHSPHYYAIGIMIH